MYQCILLYLTALTCCQIASEKKTPVELTMFIVLLGLVLSTVVSYVV